MPNPFTQLEYDAMIGALNRSLNGTFTISSVAETLLDAGWRLEQD